MCLSNQELKSPRLEENKSPYNIDNKINFKADIASSQDDEDANSEKGRVPEMRLEYLDDNKNKPSTVDIIEQPRAVLPDGSTPVITGGKKLAEMGKSLVNQALGLEPAAGQDENGNFSQSFDTSQSKVEKIKPILPIFSSDMLAKANKVNQEVSDKIAKIKAMQEELLRPKERQQSASVRSGR